jgi:hypothetical protein
MSVPIPSDFGGIDGTNDVSLNSLVNGQYANVTQDMNTALHTVGYMRINIYMDLSGLIPALDSYGNPILSRTLVQTTYVYPYTDLSGVLMNGFMTFYFDDGSYISNYDSLETLYTYRFDGLDPTVIRYFT